MKKKRIFLLLFISIVISVTALFGAPPPEFNLENLYDDDGYWAGCPNSGTTCARYPPKY